VLERCARQKDRPFFLGVGFFRPHTPYVSPRKYFDLYREKDMPVVTGIAEDQADIPAPALASRQKSSDEMSDDQRRQCRQAYYASISFMDVQVGRVLDALDRLNLSDNTVIVMTSDHGYSLGEHGLWQKFNLFEESCRVPLIIVAPGVSRKGAVVKTPVQMIDFFPTLAELCGVTPPQNLQGQSLVPMLKDPSVAGRGWALSMVPRGNIRQPETWYPNYSLRTPRWRYTEWKEGHEGRELYDHDADPKELTNLANAPEHAATVEQLSQQLRSAVRTTFPASGEGPRMPPTTWAPNLTNP
jgi:iduronate 2-sulfatase